MRRQRTHQVEEIVEASAAAVCSDGALIAAAASGGLDSMTLLHALAAVGRWRVVACHFNHGIRGEEADRDEALVRATSDRLGIGFIRAGADVPALAAERRTSLEETARACRHAFLARAAEEEGAAAIVLAHHADDQVETSIANFIRGSGARGLAGMAPWDARRRLLRPLLDVSKADLAAYAAACGVEWREDASNGGSDHDRNWLRNEIIPEIERRRPGFRRVALRQARHFADLHDFLACAARDWLAGEAAEAPGEGRLFRLEAFLRLHPMLQGEVVLQVWTRVHGSRHGFSSARLDEVLRWASAGRNGKTVFFGDDHVLVNRNGWVGTAEPRILPRP